ncbi:MAG: hypothetical protein ABL961_05950 [Vicinamibacterales bacterium]
MLRVRSQAGNVAEMTLEKPPHRSLDGVNHSHRVLNSFSGVKCLGLDEPR